MTARCVDRPSEDDDFIGFQFDTLREVPQLAWLHVVGDAFCVLQRTVFHPYLAALPRHRSTNREIFFSKRNNKTIKIVSHLDYSKLPELEIAYRLIWIRVLRIIYRNGNLHRKALVPDTVSPVVGCARCDRRILMMVELWRGLLADKVKCHV